ncbi:MAG: 23S rRNA (pseudouridine(1915)-N(3))-methyltransferase RlmH [Pseudomonadota bacterium]
MRVTICAVGRLRSGPERDIVDDYIARFDRAGRGLGLGPARILEVDMRSGGGKAPEASKLRASVPQGALVVALDERGQMLSSPDFARKLAGWRDNGTRDLAFLIGGADGLQTDLVGEADFSLSFGAMVWPHMLARAMLAEQLYRAVSILAASPYHRG